MPDFYNNNARAQFYQDDESKKNINQSSKSYWDEQNARMQQKNAEYIEDLQRYTVNIPQSQYDIIKNAIANAEIPEDEAYRWASALELNNQYNIPIESAYQNLESITASLWGQDYKFTPKTNFKAIVDNGIIGKNTLKMGEIGNKIMLAESAMNDGTMFYGEEELQALWDEYNRLEQENTSLSDNQSRPFLIEALKFGAQSAPFTGEVIGASLIGTLLAPGVGTAAGFATSMANASGLQYMKLRQAGSDQDVALGLSLVSGGLQALVEVSLGNVAGALGKNTIGNLAGEAVQNTIAGNLFKSLSYDGTFKSLALRLTKEYLKENFEEGVEEVVQDLIEKGTDKLASIIGDYEIEGLDAKTIARDAWENFRGGILGSLVLGLPTSAIKVNADIHDFATVRTLSEEVGSQEVFNVLTDDSPLFRDMTTEEKREVQRQTYENGQARKEARATQDAKQIAEGRDAAEGVEEMPAAEEGEEAPAESVARDESGKLFVQDEEYKNDEGKVTGGIYRTGNANVSGEEEGNRYGYIKYSQDENGDITIDTFKMTEGREGLRDEFFDQFAQEHPDVKIEWNAIGSDTQAIKQQLIDANPSGAKNGLSYYTTEELNSPNRSARRNVGRELRNNIHNVEKVVDQNGNVSYKRTQLTNKQVAAGIALIESAARRMGMGLAEYVQKTFGDQIFGTQDEFISTTLAQGDKIEDKAGGMRQGVAQAGWKQIGQEIKAVIYAGENADFSTWAHEMAHVFQNQLDGDLKTEAENAFNVQNGDWINSKYTFSDGREMSSAEAFAYGFQDWLETGKAENKQMQNIFQKFAQFIADCYNKLRNHLNFTPEIESVFNKLLDGDDTIMSKALKAAREEENEYRASLKRQASEVENAKKAAAKEEQKQADLAREEASETTDFVEKLQEMTVEQAESQLEETNVKETGNAIDDALENLNISDEQKAQTAEVLKDETSTIVDQADAIADAAGEQFDLFQRQDRILNQLVGEVSIRRMVESAEKARILENLMNAKDMDKRYKSMDPKEKASNIRRQTGWEKDSTGSWKYETEDSLALVKDTVLFNNLLNFGRKTFANASQEVVLSLGDIYKADDLFEIMPYLKKVRVSFYADPNGFRSVITPQGIKVNVDGVYGVEGAKSLKTSLVHEIQHVIQALEYGESKGLQGNDLRQLYYDMQDAIRAANEHDTDYDTASFLRGIKTYMENEGEIEARNVAYRVMLNADRRRNRTLASTEEELKNAKTLHQIAGEIGAQNLDNSEEVKEGVTRMQNLAIAQQMDAKGEDAKTIRLATAWEKGDDGKWKYEINDSYKYNDNKLKDTLSEAKSSYKKESVVKIKDIIDYPELFKAYPELQDMDLIIKVSENPYNATLGAYDPDDKNITLFYNDGASSQEFIDLAPSTLQHEMQHAIQYIEGFAKGGNESQFEDKVIDAGPIREKQRELSSKLNAFYDDVSKEEKKQIYDLAKTVDMDEWWNKKLEAMAKIHGDEVYKLNDQINELQDQLDEIRENALEGQVEVDNKLYGDTFEAYKSLAGEVEARNVQRRIFYTPEERLNTLLAATEDVAPEDKLILFQAAPELQDAYEAYQAAEDLLFQDELDYVREKYINTDQYLKAPNGQDTKLTEDQWLQVRTPSFKKWFGDWENDLENASKVVDENGEPLVVYHGTTEDFDVFDATKSRANMDIQGNFFSPWDIDAQGYGPNVRAFFLNIKNPADSSTGYKALNTYKGQNEAGVKARELLISQGYDGVNNDNEEYIAFKSNQIKSATDNNGDFDANNDNVLFQTTPEEQQAADTYLDTFKSAEKKRIKNNLEKFKDTPWYNSTIKSLNIRNEINDLLDGKEIAADSELKRDILKTYYEILTDGDTKEERIEHLYEYFECDSSLIGHPTKPINSVASSFINCNPSKECAKFCYAATGRNQMVNLIANRELVNWCIEHDPVRSAKMVADEYKDTREYKNGVALRLLDTGDLSAPWLDFIKELNDHGIACQIFSKRPDLLKQVDREKNVILLSIDNSNTDVAAKNPDMPIAYVYSGVQDLEYIKNSEARFKQYGGVVLPVVMNHRRLTKNEVNQLPDWSKKYTCPIDAGWKEIGNSKSRKYNTGNWNCSVCDINGQGCFFTRAVKDREKFYATLKEVPIGVLNAITEEYERFARSKLAALGLPESEIGSILAEMVNIRDQKLAGIDTEGTGGGSDSIRTALPSAPGEAGSQKGKNGSSGEAGLKLHFQKVYHGTAADFDKFDIENFAKSGEGSMNFGYGVYVTDNEDIAKDYARRQAHQKYPEKDGNLNAIVSFMLGHQISFDEAKKLVLDNSLRFAEGYEKEKIRKQIEGLKESDLQYIGKGRVYNVEIPDDSYISWDSPLNKDVIEAVNKGLRDLEAQKKFYSNVELSVGYNTWNEQYKEFTEHPERYIGEDLYIYLSAVLHGRQKASQFLNSIGFAGMKYLAGQIHGNGNGAYNYVIFNDDDVKIIDKMLYQTNAELMQEAQNFDSWQEFMTYCETFHVDIDDVSPIPSEADAQWYQSFWETAHGLQTEQEKNEQAVKEKAAREDTTASALDALFVTYIRNNPEMLDDFLHEVARIDAIDLDSDDWRNVEDDLQAAERDKIDQLKDAIAITMSDYNWQSAMRRVQGGGEISEGMRKRLLGEATDSLKSRDFRALYAEVMEDPQYAVDEEDTTSAMLSKKLQKYQKRYYDIVKPGEDISKMSPEKRKRIAEAMANRDIANKIRNGSLKLDDELDAYIKSLDRQIKEKQKQFDELEKETKADYQRIADAEKRRLLKLHDELLIARSKVTQKNSDTARKINKGLKITEKYRRESQNLQANYDELFRKFNDLKNAIQITAEVQAALDRQEQVANVREDLNAKQKEKNLTAEVKKMRIQLVKKAMRRVPFNRIDYENAKTIIAIQRMLEPNLIGGVNKFIGIDSIFLRGVISQIITDSEYKQKILNYLAHNDKSSEAFVNFKKKLQEMKSIKDFDSWTAKERKAAIKYLPKENWVRDLNLKELAKEREESIDLDIDTEEYSRPVYDEHGNPKTYKDAEGIEHNVTETAFRLRYSDELGQLVKDAVGADMFDRIINRPFSEWTTEELEQLAQRIDELYTEGRDLLAAKNEARKREAESIRKRVEDAIKETGIVINEDDTPEEKERKQKEINKILGLNSGLKGTEAGKDKGIKAKLDRLIHGYSDMNMLRFARMLDNQSEGENVYMLYRREDECYNAKTRSINNRARAINEIMKANNITEGDLAMSIPVPELGTEFTVDELLYFLAADKDYAEDEVKLAKGFVGLDANDDWAATSRNAVMFGNMMSDTASQEQKEKWVELDKAMKEALQNDTLTAEERQLDTLGQLDKTPGTTAYISYCHAKWNKVLGVANSFIAEHPEYKALMEAIEADYASQYERMNEVSINEFNMPVHRVKAYVPLVRRESNGETNVNQVKEDLLGAYGADAGKQWVNKGMTQRRVNIGPLNQKPVQTGLFATWGSSVERTEHFIAYAPYVRQLNAVYKSRDAAYTRRFIESRYGKYAVKYLDDYINEVANPNAGKIREAGSEFLHTLRGRTAPAYLGWKFSAIIKQGLTSPWPYMQFVNPAEYAAAALECTRKGTYDAIKEKSVFMHNRVMDPMNELIEEMAEEGKTKFDRAVGKFGKKGMAGLEWIDWVCVAPGWLACYKKEYARLQRASEARYDAKMVELRERNMYADIGTSQYMTPEQMEAQAQKEILEDIETEAVRYADDCTRQCQPSSRAADLAPLFKNKSEAMKAFLQFQTSLNVIWQNIRYDMPYAVRNKQFNRIVGTILGYVFAGIFMNSVMDGVTSGADDDDDKELQALRNLIFYSTTQFTDAVPIMGSELTNMFDQVITGKRGFANSGTDMTPSATKMLSAFTNASKGNWKKAATLSAEAIGMGLGAPVSGIKEINKLLGKPLDEGDIDLLRGLGDVYGIAGDFIEE